MFIKQADLFWGMDKDFISELMDVSVKETHEKGHILFTEGDPALRFYVLLKGCVKIDIGEGEQVVYIVRHGGEAFGWSGLLDRDTYSSTAQCMDKTILLRFEAMDIQRLAEDNPVNGMMFYKKLATMLGIRLIASYKGIYDGLHDSKRESFGTGQMIMSEMT
ncbi:MAG: cyclic nucleotide-binding domain-containing protein [Proteobacteria bacterium]|nr:cyclic nucleotide-binding domain-containing protein [Pseudomonadota bacterium]